MKDERQEAGNALSGFAINQNSSAKGFALLTNDQHRLAPPPRQSVNRAVRLLLVQTRLSWNPAGR